MLDLVIEGTRKDLGGGLEVGRVFAVCAPTDGWAIHLSRSHGAGGLSLW
jgi:hypothetical protein